jgi:tetratricopeptide (TPR) repeat protein
MKLDPSKELHRAAMRHAQEAYMAVLNGDTAAALPLYDQAFRLEQQAAHHFILDLQQEPTRSVLFRSAANLAFKCQKYEEAKKMVYFGLAGNPPEEIAQELMDVYQRVIQAVKLAEMPSPALDVVDKKPKASYFWLKGVLNTLNTADAQKHKITILSEDNKNSTVNVPKDLVQIVRNYWNEYVNAYILKQGKILTLVEIDKIFMQKTA